jgi:hypothetical protein
MLHVSLYERQTQSIELQKGQSPKHTYNSHIGKIEDQMR